MTLIITPPTQLTPLPLTSSTSPDVLPGFPIYSLGGDLHIFLRGGKYIFSFQLIVMTLTNISYSIVTIEKVKSYMTFFLSTWYYNRNHSTNNLFSVILQGKN